jgi:serine protease
MLSANPSLSPAQVKGLLQTSARAFPTTGGTVGTGVCQPPSSTVQDECYCTSTTCGAGMLDAGAAVQAAARAAASPNGAQADIAVSPTVPVVGESIGLNSTVTLGSVNTYAWSVVSGNANITGPTDTSSTTLVANAAGDVRVRLTLTDPLGAVTTIDQPFRVAATSSAPSSSGNSSSSSGGGGGALSWPWLLALALAVTLLAPGRRRRAQI